MRMCGVCRGPFRFDEPHDVITLSSENGPNGQGNYLACPRCVAHYTGHDAPKPRLYPVVHNPVGLPFPICSLCRTALFENESGTFARIHSPPEGVKAGAYSLCPRCVEKHREHDLELMGT